MVNRDREVNVVILVLKANVEAKVKLEMTESEDIREKMEHLDSKAMLVLPDWMECRDCPEKRDDLVPKVKQVKEDCLDHQVHLVVDWTMISTRDREVDHFQVLPNGSKEKKEVPVTKEMEELMD